MDVKKLLKIRSDTKSKKPVFQRQDADIRVEVGKKYRRPKGYHSKMRLSLKGRLPSCGYRSPSKIRGTNAQGLNEVIVSSVLDLDKVDSKTECVVISSSVGMKKKIIILEKVIEKKLPTNVDAKTLIDTLKKDFSDVKAKKTAKNQTRKNAASKAKAEKKKKNDKSKSETKKLDVSKEVASEKTEEMKKQEKILINKDKSM